jgi:GTP-binding protein HflX
MSVSFSCCCISRPSTPNHERNLSWTSPPLPNPNRPISVLTLRNHSNRNYISSRLIAGVVSSDGVSLINPVIGTEEEEEEDQEEEREEVHGALNGVADTKPPSPSTKIKKKKEEDKDDDSFENRFKLRNGREVRFF